MSTLPVTAACAALFAFMITALGFLVSLRRVGIGGVSFGDGDDVTLRRRVRAHGNFVEYAPLALICLGLLEVSGMSLPAVAGIAASFALTRLLHAAGMLLTDSPTPRAVAMMVQHLTFLACAAGLLVQIVR